ncbi:LPS assembly lipoprotein LptE [Solilutibacter silvestris]|nr:LPS assembly lipoprotein LptE [Lysobacter silvestris]
MKRLLVPVLALALSGCGFHLREAVQLPSDLGPVRVVSSDPYSPLGEALSEAMTRAGAVPADPKESVGVATLEVISERWGDIPISLDQYGRAQEFSLRYAVIFALRGANGKDVVPQQAIELTRDYVAPAADAVGKASEHELLAKEMRRDMAAAVMRRIDAVSRKINAK